MRGTQWESAGFLSSRISFEGCSRYQHGQRAALWILEQRTFIRALSERCG